MDSSGGVALTEYVTCEACVHSPEFIEASRIRLEGIRLERRYGKVEDLPEL